jgi:CheY-like chemotaxis protein
MQVLVVDDDGYTRAVLREILEDDGYSVLSAPDGQTARGVLGRAKVPMVVLLDQRMPGLSGLEVVAAARGGGHQFILVTAAPADALAAGQVPVLAKPFHIEALLDAVAQAAARLDGQRVEARRADTGWRRRSHQQ